MKRPSSEPLLLMPYGVLLFYRLPSWNSPLSPTLPLNPTDDRFGPQSTNVTLPFSTVPLPSYNAVNGITRDYCPHIYSLPVPLASSHSG